MSYQLQEINQKLSTNPLAFVEECEAQYQRQVEAAAQQILVNMKACPIVLLSGPSGSGKTTTAIKLAEELAKQGVTTHPIAMDNYFKTLNRKTAPRTPEGDIDFESPLLLDMSLLDETFTKLSAGEWVVIPKYEFTRQMRNDSQGEVLKLAENEIAIFEGIHALNDEISAHHPEATTMYISARSNIMDGDDLLFKGTWMRMSRRAVRDYNFRGTDLSDTFSMWYNVRRGEKSYISPFKDRAQITIDSAIAYEPALFQNYALPLAQGLAGVPEDTQRYEEIGQMITALNHFVRLDPNLVPENSLLREFMGGGVYGY